jgi:predicted AlkP superfamily pyrophosphatase or phosphodiesterase
VKIIKKMITIGTLFILCVVQKNIYCFNNQPPKLTVIVVVDQMAYSYFNKLTPFFKYGLKYLLDHAVIYTNTTMPNGYPCTAAGHALFNTGTTANNHGFVGNKLINDEGKIVTCDYDDAEQSAVLSPDGVYDHGRSAQYLMVDGITDQCVLQSTPSSPFSSYSISLKSRSAIATAGKLGKALWFDQHTGFFTSSKAYFDTLPHWVQQFNKEKDVSNTGMITWQRMYQQRPYAYTFFNVDNYQFAHGQKTMIDIPLAVPDISHPKHPYHLFQKTPYANKLLLDCALTCINNHVSRKDKNRLLLWVCLSPLDKVGHKYGPDSLEAIDMIYHLDKQLQKFIRRTLQSVGKHQVLFVLTADHGIMPIPELLNEAGLTQAKRINQADFMRSINEAVDADHQVPNIVIDYLNQGLVLDNHVLEPMDAHQHEDIIHHIKELAFAASGIKNVWTLDEISRMTTQPNTIEDNIKKQIYPGRCGSLIAQPKPYSLITNSLTGTSHETPYEYDTHIPLMIFHPGKFERKYVRQPVSALQLANTIAELLNVPKPSASTSEVLPELFDIEYQ